MTIKLKKIGVRQYLTISRKVIGLQLKGFSLYPASLITDIISIAVGIGTSFFMADMVSTTNPLGANYFPFLIIGSIVNSVLSVSLYQPYGLMSELYWSTNIESFLLSPAPLWLHFLINMLCGYLFNSIFTILFIFIGVLYGFQVSPSASLLRAFAVIGLSAMAVLGFGFLAASTFYLLEAKAGGNPVTWAMEFIIRLVSGFYYPVTFLPVSLQLVSLIIPYTYAYDGLRRALLPSGSFPNLPIHSYLPFDPLTIDLLVLTLLIVMTVPLGWLLIKKGIERARADGTLTSWV